MNRKLVVFLAVLAAIGAVAGIVIAANSGVSNTGSSSQERGSDQPANADIEPNQEQSAAAGTPECPASQDTTITYSNGEFTPACITVKSGTQITWVNSSSGEVEIGADPHPTHTGNKEVSEGGFVLTIAPGSRATSRLTTAGNHGYHNHLNSNAEGVIVVE